MHKKYIVMRVTSATVEYWTGSGWGTRPQALVMRQVEARKVASEYMNTSLVEVA